MKTYFCDGSQYRKLGIMSAGIVTPTGEHYLETEDLNPDSCMYEIYAILKTIKIAEQTENYFEIVNDDRFLVDKIMNKKWNNKIDEIKFALKKGIVRSPKNQFEKKQLRKCHEISRMYLNEKYPK